MLGVLIPTGPFGLLFYVLTPTGPFGLLFYVLTPKRQSAH